MPDATTSVHCLHVPPCSSPDEFRLSGRKLRCLLNVSWSKGKSAGYVSVPKSSNDSLLVWQHIRVVRLLEKQNLKGSGRRHGFLSAEEHSYLHGLQKAHNAKRAVFLGPNCPCSGAAPGVNNASSNLKRIQGSFYLDPVGSSPSNYRYDTGGEHWNPNPLASFYCPQ